MQKFGRGILHDADHFFLFVVERAGHLFAQDLKIPSHGRHRASEVVREGLQKVVLQLIQLFFRGDIPDLDDKPIVGAAALRGIDEGHGNRVIAPDPFGGQVDFADDFRRIAFHAFADGDRELVLLDKTPDGAARERLPVFLELQHGFGFRVDQLHMAAFIRQDNPVLAGIDDSFDFRFFRQELVHADFPVLVHVLAHRVERGGQIL